MSAGSIAVSGLQAAETRMESIANNIANINTPGYKRVYTNFADAYSSANQTVSPGFGVEVLSLEQDFTSGRVELSNSNLDLSINTSDFFIQKDSGTGQVSYTRNGILKLDSSGYIRTQDGSVLQGYAASNGVISTSTLSDLQIPQNPIAGTPTTNVAYKINLNAGDPNIPSTTFSPTDASTYNYLTSTTIFDSLGASHSLQTYYIESATPGTWDIPIYVDGACINPQNAATPPVYTYATVSFDSTGAYASSTGLSSLSFATTNGSSTPQSISIDYAKSTQYATNYLLSNVTQDGYAAGDPLGFQIDASGNITVQYSSGISKIESQIALAGFAVPQSLERINDMSWTPTTASGAAVLQQNLANSIATGATEYSNVDLPTELVELLDTQHYYSANAEVERTYNKILDIIEGVVR